MLIQENLSIQEKLKILTDAAKYDVSCTSSGVERKGKNGSMGSASESGICHSFAADGRCISLLKILFTNQCIYDCKYCINRCSNDTVRTSFTPEEVCSLTMEFYQRNYIEGLFLSSGILHSPDYTMDLIYQAIYKLRVEYRFRGYIHVKAIPGTDPELIERLGFLADRMSVNLELPTADGLKRLAPAKTREKILRPMRQIQQGILSSMDRRPGIGVTAETHSLYLPGGETELSALKPVQTSERGVTVAAANTDSAARVIPSKSPELILGRSRYGMVGVRHVSDRQKVFVPAGQSTQMMVGASGESDFQLLSVSEALYQRFGVKRVFYSAYVPINQDSALPALVEGPPLLREHRLYQADWLMRYYGFDAGELLSEKHPNFHALMDPKCDWAVRNLDQFPVEVNLADYHMLLRVPGMGPKSVARILSARKHGKLQFEDLKKFGVVLKRAQYFITCSGKLLNPVKLDQDYISGCLIYDDRKKNQKLSGLGYRQLSLFDDLHLSALNG